MLPQETHHHLIVLIHFETKTGAQRKEDTTRTHESMAHVPALGLVLLVYCSMLQQIGVEAKARATEDRVNTITCMPGTYDKKNLHRRRKGHAHPHPSFSWRTGRIITNQASVRSKLDDVVGVRGQPVSISACDNITSSVNFLSSEKACLSKWSQIRVLRIEKISIASVKDVVVLTQFSRDVHGG